MDRKSIVILVVCFLLLILWGPLMTKLYPPPPKKPGDTNIVATATSNVPVATVPSTSAPPTLSAGPPLPPALTKSAPSSSAPESLIEVTNEHAHYTFTSQGGGLKLVELTSYPESVGKQGKQDAARGRVATLNGMAPLPALALLAGDTADPHGTYQLTRTATGVRAEHLSTNGLAVVKDFVIGTNYLVLATMRMTNRSDRPLALPEQEWIVGTATPMGPEDNGMNVGLMWFNGRSENDIVGSWFDNRTLGCIPGTPRTEYRDGATNVTWAAAHNQFFALAAIAATNAPAFQVVGRRLDLDRPANWPLPKPGTPRPKGYVTSLAYPPVTLAPGQGQELRFTIFAGPKEYRTLARIADQMENKVDLLMGYGGFFGFFAKILLLSMNGLHDLLRVGYGWAIILITIVIKLLFWPLTAASTRSMKRMSALQPQMKALQEKYKDDPAKMNKKLMEFMKENKVSPLGGCLPMLLQIPVFFGFYRMIQSAIELRGASFLWVADLSKPDTLFDVGGWPVNLLPLLMGVTMLWQARLTPPSPGMDPMQQKIMQYMPLMFLFMLYNFSAGLTLYWTVQNLLTIAQTKLTRAQAANQPAAQPSPAAAGPPKKKK